MALLRDTRLRAFHAVALHKNFTKAAQQLLLTQQAVSFQIKSLEDEVGAEVFRRGSGGAELTGIGRTLFLHADRILLAYRDAEAALAKLSGKRKGELRISATNSLAKYVISRAIGRFRQRYPDTKVTMKVGNSDYTMNCLNDGLSDVAFVSEGPTSLGSCEVEQFFQDKIAFIAAPQYVRSGSNELSLREFCQMQFVLREEGSATRQLLTRALEQRGVKLDDLNIVLVVDSPEAVKAAVITGPGIGAVSRLCMLGDLSTGTLSSVRVPELDLSRNFCVVRSPHRRAPRCVDQFVRVAKEMVEDRRSPAGAS